MSLRRICNASTAAAVLVCAAGAAQAGTLTFDGLGLADGAEIPQTHGDNAADTPHVSVSYRSIDVTDPFSQVFGTVNYWGPDYGDLSGVAYNAGAGLSDRYFLEIALVADPGYEVTLDSFQIAGYLSEYNPSFQNDPTGNWPIGDWEGQTLWILDEDGNDLLFDDDLVVHGGTAAAPTHDTFTPNFTSGRILIRLGPSLNVGIDNVVFSERGATRNAVVPLPPAAALGFLGMGLAALVRRRRRAPPAA